MRSKTTFFPMLLVAAIAAGCASETSRPNVLFLSIDDLRPELGSYGLSHLKTPEIDKLASEGLLFERHYVQFAVCIPSRVALLTSLSSERTHQVYGKIQWQGITGATAMGNRFGQAGYETVSLGKIWHVPSGSSSGDAFDVTWKPNASNWVDPAAMDLLLKVRATKDPDKRARLPKPPITECLDVEDSAYADGLLAERAIEELRRLAGSDRPFLLAVGFYKPHLPFCAPKKYWDLYDPAQIDLAPNPDLPEAMPEVAFNRHPNMFNYDYGDYPKLVMGERMPDETARHLRHAYRACVSFIDAQVGRLLDELDHLGLRDNTIVMFWGDHGWHLGDSGMWSKHSNFEAAAHSPLMVSAPGQKARGVKTRALVETIDIFPTLLDLCGIAPLQVSDGRSFAPLLDDPTLEWKDAAFHVFNRRRSVDGENRTIIGHAMRTARYRYVAWRLGWDLDGKLVAEELYDYEADPHETRNFAGDPEYAEIREKLAGQMREKLEGFRPAP